MRHDLKIADVDQSSAVEDGPAPAGRGIGGTRMFRRIGGRMLAGATVALLAGTAHANSASATCSPLTVASPGYCSGSSSDSHGSSEARGLAIADYGVLKGSATAAAVTFSVGGVYAGHASASASASFSDSLTITSPGLNGKRGTTSVQAFLRQTGVLVTWPTPLATAGAYARLFVTTPSTTTATYRIVNYALSASNSSTTYAAYNDGQAVGFGAPIVDSFDFTFGQPFSFTFLLQVGASAQRDGIATLSAGDSAYWAGLGEVYYLGDEVSNFSLTSASGTDYSKSFVPVPEVSSRLLLLVGVLLLFLTGALHSRPSLRACAHCSPKRGPCEQPG